MKSLKSVLVVAFACAMLFAFTACEQAPINMPSSDADKEVAKVTFVSSTTTFYEGESYGNVPVVVDVMYKDGSVTENVTALMTANGVQAGANAFPTVLTATANNPNNYLVEVEGIAIEGLEVVAGETFTANILTITEKEYEDWNPSAGISIDPESVKLLYADGTTGKALQRKAEGGYTVSYDSTDKAKVTSAVFKYDEIEQKLAVTVEKPADKVEKWQIQINGEAGNAADVTWGDSRSDFTSQLSVVALGAGDVEIGVVDADRYTVLGLPAKFNEYDEDEAAVLSYTVTLVATNAEDVKFVDTTSKANEITITVEDPIDWDSLEYDWVANTKFVVGGSVDEKAIEISALTTASGEDKASTASISAIAGNNFTDYSKGDKVWVNFIVTCGTETSEQQRIQTDALVEA